MGGDYRLLSPLERALITMGRDNALRHVYLRKRWWGREALLGLRRARTSFASAHAEPVALSSVVQLRSRPQDRPG